MTIEIAPRLVILRPGHTESARTRMVAGPRDPAAPTLQLGRGSGSGEEARFAVSAM